MSLIDLMMMPVLLWLIKHGFPEGLPVWAYWFQNIALFVLFVFFLASCFMYGREWQRHKDIEQERKANQQARENLERLLRAMEANR